MNTVDKNVTNGLANAFVIYAGAADISDSIDRQTTLTVKLLRSLIMEKGDNEKIYKELSFLDERLDADYAVLEGSLRKFMGKEIELPKFDGNNKDVFTDIRDAVSLTIPENVVNTPCMEDVMAIKKNLETALNKHNLIKMHKTNKVSIADIRSKVNGIKTSAGKEPERISNRNGR